MKLFDISFGNSFPKARELYVRGKGSIEYGSALILGEGAEVDFESYFNILPLYQYAQFCGVQKFALEIKAEGNYSVEIFSVNEKGNKTRLSACQYSGDSSTEFEYVLTKERAYAFFKITALEKCSILSAAWLAPDKAAQKAKIGIVICTYKREKFVQNNLERIQKAIESNPEWAKRLHVFVIDNARTLDLPEKDFYTVIKNPNLGGSGGFTRGIVEVCKDQSFTHFLLTDDDIVFDFNVIARTYRLLSALAPEHKYASVGGAMLVLERPCIQHELGGIFNGSHLCGVNGDLDMRERQNLIKNLRPAKPDYTAWWYCCMSVESVKKHGLPMPYFIKCDDVEYGIRAIDELILTSGIAVWHQDFAGKYTGALEYYIKRNEAATAALHGKAGALKTAAKFYYAMLKMLCLKNYDGAELIYKAYKDFMRADKFFLNTNPEKVHSEISQYRTQFISAEEIEKLTGVNPENCELKKPASGSIGALLTLICESRRAAYAFSNKPVVVHSGKPDFKSCKKARTVIHYDPAAKKGFICTLDKNRRKKLRRAARKAFWGLLFGYGKAKRALIKRRAEICSAEHWQTLFNTINSQESN